MEVRKKNIIDEVSSILEKRIAGRIYKTGDCLPSQNKLAEELGISRNSVREAITRLTIMGMVKPVQGVGTIVQANRANPMLQQALKQFNLSQKSASTILETRMVIERAVVRLAALRARKTDIVNLEKNLARQQQILTQTNRDKFPETDVEFHLLLAKASRNKLLLEIQESNLLPFKNLVQGVMQLPIVMEFAAERHAKILKGIRRGDPLVADREMVAHLRHTVGHLTETEAIREAKEALLF